VAKDQVLFELEREQFQAALDLAEANLASARAELELAEATFKRVSTLEGRGTASQAQLDSALAALQSASPSAGPVGAGRAGL
jgi:membrane fusion protein, multidrug efflux system